MLVPDIFPFSTNKYFQSGDPWNFTQVELRGRGGGRCNMGGMSGCRVSEGSRIFVEVILECRECTRTGKTELDGIRVRSRGQGGRDTRSGRSHIYHEFVMRTWVNYFYLMPRLAPFVTAIDKHSSLRQDEL